MKRPKSTATDPKPALTPKLRFPEFHHGLAWHEKSMGDTYSFKGNNSLSREKLNYKNGAVKNIHYGDIHTKFSTLFDITKESVPFINPSESLDGFRAENDCAERDMVFADASEDLDDIGKSIEIIALNGERVVAGLHTILARPNGGELATGFGGYLFKCRRVRVQIEKESQGSKVLGISATRLAKIDLPFPPTCAEQRKIAECLSTLDELIEAESDKLESLKLRKSWLLQQLFPREPETTPRLRFREFRNAGAWPTKLGGELFTNRKEVGEKGLPIYSVTINDGMIPRASFDRDFSDIEEPAGNKKVCQGDIAYNMMRMWQGAQGVARKDCMVSPAYVVLAPRSGVCPYFFAYLFKLPQSLLLLTAISRGLTKDRLRLYFDDFARMKLCIPDFAEQQKIASCLASLDELIAAQGETIEALTTHKKGLMQRLFPTPEVAEA